MSVSERVIPSRYPHAAYVTTVLEDKYGSYTSRVRTYAGDPEAALISSEVVDVVTGKPTGSHTVMLDIDLPAALIPSSTADHYHLYIDAHMSWRQYRRLLRALSRAGVIEKGYYKASVARRGTHLRLPWIKKESNK